MAYLQRMHARPLPWPVLGAVGGALCGAVDFALFHGLAPDLGRWNIWALAAVFIVNMAVLGLALGHLYVARGQARSDAAIIREQLSALERTGRAAAQAEKLAALGRVAAGIAHEVRNPLGVIRSAASLIDEDLDAARPDSRRACRFVIEECDRLDRLVGSLLLFARPGRPREMNFPLREVIARTHHLAEPTLGKSVTLRNELPADLPEIAGDPDLVQQVLFGLLVNATEAGATQVIMRAGKSERAVWIDVSDDGSGVPEEHADAIFEPFFTTKESGTGLGLPTAARIAEAHGGSLVLRRGSERGACFRLILPAAAEVA